MKIKNSIFRIFSSKCLGKYCYGTIKYVKIIRNI